MVNAANAGWTAKSPSAVKEHDLLHCKPCKARQVPEMY